MMICHCRFMICSKWTMLLWDFDGGGGCVCWAGSMKETPVPSAQFCCEPIPVLKNCLFKSWKNMETVYYLKLYFLGSRCEGEFSVLDAYLEVPLGSIPAEGEGRKLTEGEINLWCKPNGSLGSLKGSCPVRMAIQSFLKWGWSGQNFIFGIFSHRLWPALKNRPWLRLISTDETIPEGTDG